ncbi:hypothetical protein GCM10010521_18650 [Streptomyces rameus]|uniref:Uncharacterized protein n=1 Tax=Streptomyces rameus TaxID=68261 RepID=A0ABP6N3A1_9ACTN
MALSTSGGTSSSDAWDTRIHPDRRPAQARPPWGTGGPVFAAWADRWSRREGTGFPAGA